MSDLEFDWPDEGGEQVRAAQGRLIAAGEALRARRFEERLAIVADVLAMWTAPDSPWRRELVQALAACTSFSEGTIREGLDSALRAWRPADLVACAEREIGAQLVRGGGRALSPFEWTLVVAGGAIPMPTILTALLPLVLGSPVLLRETRHDPVTPALLARSIAERDETLARAFEPVRFPVEDAAAYAAALEAPCVVATGSDEALDAVRARCTSRTRFVGYGHRFSIGVVGPEIDRPSSTGATGSGAHTDDETLDAVARGFALDVARWDQSGCLSPVLLYLVDVPRPAAERLTHAIGSALDALEAEMPRGALESSRSVEIANERASARMRSESASIVEGEGHTVLLEVDETPRPAPLGRFLRLHPVASVDALASALRRFHGHLSTAAIAGFASPQRPIEEDSTIGASPSIDTREITAALVGAGVSRVTSPGAMQTPEVDWPHDGLPLFGPLARFVAGPRIGLLESD